MLGGGGGGNLQWTSIPDPGVAANYTPSYFMLQKPREAPVVWATWPVC